MLPFILAVDFMNFTYATNPCAQNVPVPVRMRKGEFSYVDKTAADFDLHVNSVTRGSLAPGTHQAVVVIACDFPVGGTAEAYVFDDHGKSARLLRGIAQADWGADWGRGPDSIHVRFSNYMLHLRQCSDSECTAATSTTYVLRNGRLIELRH